MTTVAELREFAQLGLDYATALADERRALERSLHPNGPSKADIRVFQEIATTAGFAFVGRFKALADAVRGEESAQAQTTPERMKIHTIEELDALPQNAVVMDLKSDYDQVYQKCGDRWSGDERSYDSGQLDLPVEILWLP